MRVDHTEYYTHSPVDWPPGTPDSTYFVSTLKLVNVALKVILNKVNGVGHNSIPFTGLVHWIILRESK